MRVVIIIPTYNEAENIGLLIDALEREAVQLTQEIHVMVVDDNSPDGTAEQVRKRMEKSRNVHLLTGEKEGLGAAYIRGMRFASTQLGADIVFEMDADFSHKPEDVPRLLRAVEEGHDFVIGSRYVRGGSIPKEWQWYRRLNSRVGNIVARYVAGLYGVKDCTAGFRAIRTSLLKKIDLRSIGVQGYAFQVALLNKAMMNGARIKEVPVDFIDRARGESKLGLRDIVEFIINVWWIRVQSSTTFIKFGIVGASGVLVNLCAFSLLLWGGINKYLASPIAIEISIIWNFALNNFWTFRWRKTRYGSLVKGLKFNVVSFLSLSINYGTFLVLSYISPNLEPHIPQLIGIIPASLVNYFLNSYWTFHSAVPMIDKKGYVTGEQRFVDDQ